MNPWISILGSALGGLGGLFGSPNTYSPQQLASYFGPQALMGDWSKIYQGLQASPQFQNTINQMMLQGSQLSNNLAQGFAQRGLTQSGIGTIAQQMGNSAAGFQTAQARAGLGSTALDIAQQNLMARMAALMSPQNQQPQGIRAFLGNILSSAGPALAQYYSNKTLPQANANGTDGRPPDYGVGVMNNFGAWNPNAGSFQWNPGRMGGGPGIWG